jgi:hypothetical protein
VDEHHRSEELNGALWDRPDYLSSDFCTLDFHRVDKNAPPVATRKPK